MQGCMLQPLGKESISDFIACLTLSNAVAKRRARRPPKRFNAANSLAKVSIRDYENSPE